MPQFVPEYLGLGGVSEADDTDLKRGDKPSLSISWHGRGGDSTVSESAYRLPGVRLVQTRASFDLDLGEDRRQVEVDSVHGWLTYLGRDDFYPPDLEGDFRSIEDGWPEGASGLKSYSGILFHRHLPGQSELAPSVDAPSLEDPVEYLSIDSACDRAYVGIRFECIERKDVWPSYTLFGEAIALQWNRGGMHYILIAQNIEPLILEDLFEMADSMVQPKLPSTCDRNWLRALRVLLGD